MAILAIQQIGRSRGQLESLKMVNILQFGGSVGTVNGVNTSAVDDMANLSTGGMTINANYNQTITLNNPLTVNWSLSMASGTGVTIAGAGTGMLSIKGANAAWNWGGGTINVYTVFSTPGGGGTITINGSDVTLNSTLVNNGTINWSSNNPQQGPGPNINLGTLGRLSNTGTFNIQTTSTEKINGQADSLFSNSGIVQKTGANTTTINAGYSQARGSLTVNSGTLAFQQAFSAAGGSVVLNGGNISSVQSMTIGAPASLSGVGTVTVTNAMGLQNSGSVIPGVNGIPGTLTLVGNYTQKGSTGALVINIDSAGNFGIFNVQGTATLTGQLNVNHNANYQPPEGTNLVFMTYTSVSGDFSTFNISNQGWTTPQGVMEFQPNKSTTDYELDTVAI
ncbi:MAG TPA: hypothetical protein VH682_24280 [Gemmataceae bacterium]